MTESTEAGEATGGLPAALRACVYERQPDGRWRCGRCGDTTRRPSERPPRRSCPTARAADATPFWVQAVAQVAAADKEGLGLGDLTAAGLSAIGITKERVERWWGDCGCRDRQDWLNRFGRRVREFLGV